MKATTNVASSINVGCLVMRISLGKVGKDYQSYQEGLIRRNGYEFTCKRAKAIWNVANLLRSGNKQMAISVCRDNSIAHSPHTGIPKGIEGSVVKRYISAQRPSVVKRMAAVLRWYTSIRLSKVSSSQKKKAFHAITDPSKAKIPPSEIREWGRKDINNVLWHVAKQKFDTSHPNQKGFRSWGNSYITRYKKSIRERVDRIAYADKLKPTSKYYSRNKVPHEVRGTPYSSMTMSLITEPWLPSSIDKRTPCFEHREEIRHLPDWPDQEFAGKISFLQEQGCKARVVAQPSAYLQLAFVPLHETIAHVAEELFPINSCVRDQIKGADQMAMQLIKGRDLYCTDLSSATDRFPIEYSLGILDGLGLFEWSEALQEVVSKPFRCDEHPEGKVIYRVGQPMGLYSSFPLFHLSNMTLAMSSELIARKRDEVKYLDQFYGNTTFRTVGDDMVFSSKEVEHYYRQFLQVLGVDLSEPKSYQGKIAEFAGFISTPTTRGAVTFRPYKVPDGEFIKNPIQFLEAIGSKVKNVTRRKSYWENQWKIYQYTRPYRDIALESVIPLSDDTPFGINTYRGDTNTVKNMTNVIMYFTNDPIPDLSLGTRINTYPLFLERGMFDYYGYNPEKLTQAVDREWNNQFKQSTKSLRDDPLMRSVQSGKLKDIISFSNHPGYPSNESYPAEPYPNEDEVELEL